MFEKMQLHNSTLLNFAQRYNKSSGEQNNFSYFLSRDAVYLHGIAIKFVQIERNTKFYLSISEMQPIFKLRSRLKFVQTERITKFYLGFSEVQPN